ncbi:MAG: FKBP-type peptidyl-prolyl cis-trans isomerase [Bacteroidota bacterium]
MVGCLPKETIRTAHTKSYITIAYEGRLPDGTVFDSSPRRAFQLSNTIEGFQIHIRGMAVGETKTFDVPPEQGYGEDPPEGIPPNTTLTFTVTLLRVQ